MELRQLEIFLSVARKRSFSVAAEERGLTQPTVSFQIAALEAELESRLFDRGGRTTTLTRSGEVLHRYAREMLDLSREAKRSIHDLKGLLWGEIKLGASTIPGEYILPVMLPGFREAYPGISVEMVIGDTADVKKLVLGDEVEIGIVGASEKSDKLVFTPFVSDRLVLIAPIGDEWFANETATTEELAKAPFIMRENGSGTRAIMERRLSEIGLSSSGLNVCMLLGSTEAVKRAVQSGAGVSIVSERAVENEVKLGLMRAMEIGGLELVRDFYIVCRSQKSLSPAAEALLGFLRETSQ